MQHGCKYRDLFDAFASGDYSGICLGVYRDSTQSLGHGHPVELPIVITTPHDSFEVVANDKLFVLIGIHTLERAASRIQGCYRRRKGVRARKASEEDSISRSSISKYLGVWQQPNSDSAALHDPNRRSLYAQAPGTSFTSYVI